MPPFAFDGLSTFWTHGRTSKRAVGRRANILEVQSEAKVQM